MRKMEAVRVRKVSERKSDRVFFSRFRISRTKECDLILIFASQTHQADSISMGWRVDLDCGAAAIVRECANEITNFLFDSVVISLAAGECAVVEMR